MNLHRIHLTPLLALVLALTTQGLLAQQVRLRYISAPGEVLKYRTTTTIIQTGEIFRVSQAVTTVDETSSYRTEKVNEDSSLDIVMTIEKVEVHFNREKVYSERESLKGVPILLRRATSGKYLDVHAKEDVSSEQEEMISRMTKDLEIERGFADRPVAVGETWENEVASSFDVGELRIEQVEKERSKLIGFEKFQGVRCAVVKMWIDVKGTVTTQFEEVPVKGEGRGNMMFDYANGRMVQVWYEFETTATVQTSKGPGELRSTFSMKTELVP